MKNPNFFSGEYCSPARMASFGYQVKELLTCQVENVLEIGCGNKLVTYILRRYGINVTTLDLNESLGPDIIASVVAMPLPSKAYDGVLCCQVLEHLPFDQFGEALNEIGRVVRSYLVLSLPDVTRQYRIELTLPGFRFKIYKNIHGLLPRKHVFDGEHHWEIGKRGYSLKRIRTAIERADFSIIRSYRFWEHPYHRIFICHKP